MNEDLFFISAKALIQNSQGEILLVHKERKDSSFWELPGGRLNRGETIEQGIERELYEEIGLILDIYPSPVDLFLTDSRIQLTNNSIDSAGLAFYLFELNAPENFFPTLSSEHTQFRWFHPSLVSEKLKDSCPKPLIEWIEHSRQLKKSLKTSQTLSSNS